MNSKIILTLEKQDIDSFKDVLNDLKAVTCAEQVKERNLKVEFIE